MIWNRAIDEMLPTVLLNAHWAQKSFDRDVVLY